MISRTVTQTPGEPMEDPGETFHPDPEVVANAWVGDWRARSRAEHADRAKARNLVGSGPFAVAPTGVDPVTFRFSVERSTN